MIVNIISDDTELIFKGKSPKRLPQTIVSAAKRKLDQLDCAIHITDLRNPPGNRLELLKGNRDGQYSIRVNDQYRICFRWEDRNPEEGSLPAQGDAYDVEIVDYH